MLLTPLKRVRCRSVAALPIRLMSITTALVHEALQPSQVGKKLAVKGWIKSLRNQKCTTFIDLQDGLSCCRLQVVLPSEKLPPSAAYHAAICAVGTLAHSEHPAQQFELLADQVQVVCGVGTPHREDLGADKAQYPFDPRKFYADTFTRMFPMFRAKLNDFTTMLRVRHALSRALHEFFAKQDFIQIHTPIITAQDCEGAGETFTVVPASPATMSAMKRESVKSEDEAYFNSKVYLSVSGQLHLEAMCNGLAKVYSFAPAFRAEMGRSRRHLSEFYMVEAEQAFVSDLEPLLDLMQSCVQTSVRMVMDSNMADVELYLGFGKKKGQTRSTAHLDRLTSTPFKVLSYAEAMDVLEKNAARFTSRPVTGQALGKEHELFLAEQYCQGVPVFVVDWPRSLKPFYCQVKGSQSTVSAVDLLLPWVGELCGGSVREHQHDVLLDSITQKGLNAGRLGWYLDLRECGAAPTAGFGLGFERLIQFMLQITSIRDCIPFSRAPHHCRL